MINNYICENCSHFGVCKWNDKITPFHEDSKKPLGVNITVNDCDRFEDVNAE